LMPRLELPAWKLLHGFSELVSLDFFSFKLLFMLDL
jgi:hypothetical protein